MLTIHGKGGHGRVILDASCGRSVRVTDDADGTKPAPGDPNIIAIGDNAVRARMHNEYTVSVYHPRLGSLGRNTTVGKGTYLGAGVNIGPGVKIGVGCIINTGAIVEHDCVVGDFSHVAPGAVLCGTVTIGRKAFVGANATVKEGITIGDGAIVGCGAVVLADIGDGETWAGVPARRIR